MMSCITTHNVMALYRQQPARKTYLHYPHFNGLLTLITFVIVVNIWLCQTNLLLQTLIRHVDVWGHLQQEQSYVLLYDVYSC